LFCNQRAQNGWKINASPFPRFLSYTLGSKTPASQKGA
jgi:hypothetical protein